MKFALFAIVAVSLFAGTADAGVRRDVNLSRYDNQYRRYVQALEKTLEVVEFQSLDIMIKARKNKVAADRKFLRDLLADAKKSGGRYRNSNCGELGRHQEMSVNDTISKSIALIHSGCSPYDILVHGDILMYVELNLKSTYEENPIATYLDQLDEAFKARKHVAYAHRDRYEEITFYEQQVERSATAIKDEIAERNQNENLSCEEIGEKASDVLKKVLLKVVKPSLMATTEQMSASLNAIDKTTYYTEYSARCFQDEESYREDLRELERTHLIAGARFDTEVANVRTIFRSRVEEFLSQKKIYLNVSEAKLNSCQAAVNAAIKQNVRNECYSNLVQKDYTASIFETKSYLLYMSKEARRLSKGVAAQ